MTDLGDRRGSVTAHASRRFSFAEILVHLRGLYATRRMGLSTSLIWFSWLLIGLAYPLYNVFLPTYLATRGAALGGLSQSDQWRNYAIANAASIPSPILAGYMCKSGLFWGRRGTMVIGALITMVFFFAYTQVKSNAQNLGFTCAIGFCLPSSANINHQSPRVFWSRISSAIAVASTVCSTSAARWSAMPGLLRAESDNMIWTTSVACLGGEPITVLHIPPCPTPKRPGGPRLGAASLSFQSIAPNDPRSSHSHARLFTAGSSQSDDIPPRAGFGLEPRIDHEPDHSASVDRAEPPVEIHGAWEASAPVVDAWSDDHGICCTPPESDRARCAGLPPRNRETSCTRLSPTTSPSPTAPSAGPGPRPTRLSSSPPTTHPHHLLTVPFLPQNIYYGTLYAYTPEVLPSAHRGTGNGISIALNRFMGIMSAVVATYADTSTPVPIYVCATLYIVMAIVAGCFPFEPMGSRSS
ncbi:Major Facilitator Super [Teratosphaeriaceae sp. CCFEE 6253]|nr:Major Facilitator Super [Teratosphaeriaceae sp. CCFEE 6253]